MTSLRLEDVKKVLRSVRALYDRRADPGLVGTFALQAACRLAGAEAGMACQSPIPLEYPPRLKGSSVSLGWTPSQSALWLAASSAPALETNPTNRAVRPLRSKAFTVARRDLARDAVWYRSRYLDEHLRPIGVDDHVVSTCPVPGRSTISALALYRPWGARPFSDREVAMVQLFHEELSWVLARSERDAVEPDMALDGSCARLPPRQRETLAALLQGASEKEIAERLAISPHTVHGYVKTIHRELGVRSRGELLSMFISSRHASRSAHAGGGELSSDTLFDPAPIGRAISASSAKRSSSEWTRKAPPGLGE